MTPTPTPTSTYAAAPPPPSTTLAPTQHSLPPRPSSAIPQHSLPPRPSSAISSTTQRMIPHLRDGNPVLFPPPAPAPARSVSVKSSPAMSEFANDFGALPFQNSDSVNMYDAQFPRVQQYQDIPYNQAQIPVQNSLANHQPRQLSQSIIAQTQTQSSAQQPQQPDRPTSQASFLQFPQYPSGLTLQQLLQQQQQQHQQQYQQQQQQAVQHAFHNQQQHQPPPQPPPQSQQQAQQPLQPQPDPLTLQQWIQLQQPQQQQHQHLQSQVQVYNQQQPQPQQQQQQQQAVPPSRPPSQLQIRPQVDNIQPPQQHGSTSSSAPVATMPSAKPIIHDELGVMMPIYEPSTGLLSYCTLDRFIQQHIKAATGDPSPQVLNLQSEVDRLRNERNQAVKHQHTIHGQYTELVRTHNEHVVHMRTLDTTIATAKKEFETNLETIVELRAGYKVEQDRANEASKARDRDAAKLAKVMAELNDIKTVINHPGVLFAKLQAEVDAKEEFIKKLKQRVAKAEEADKVAKDLRHMAEDTAAQRARESEGLQTTINRLSAKVSELENECAQHKDLKYDLAVARSDLKNANARVTGLQEAQSGIMARSDKMRTKNDALTQRVAELEAEALLPMPSALLVNPVATGDTTPFQISLLKRELEKTGAALAQAQAENAQLKFDSETEAARSKVGWAVRRTQIKDSQDAQVLAESTVRDLRARNEQLSDQNRELMEMISKYKAQIELPPPSQIANPPAREHQHSVIVCDLQLEIATYKSELDECRAELKQSQVDLEEARFPWYGMVLEQEAQGQKGEGKKEAVDIVKAKIHALEATITTLQSTNGDLQLQLDKIAAGAELKRLKDLAIGNARERNKLKIFHSRLIDLTSPSPTSSPTVNPESTAVNDEKMEVEIEGDCGCGREEVINEMASRSEAVFEQTLHLLDNVRTAAQIKLDESPLKDRSQRVRSVEILTKYLERVEGLVEHAREGVANRL